MSRPVPRAVLWNSAASLLPLRRISREVMRLFEIPLRGDERWQLDGEVPLTARAVSLAFDSWGAPTLRLWIDGLALE